jgi:hypothetical protein
MKIKSIPKKAIAQRLALVKKSLLNEHSQMMYNHLESDYMRMRAKEEILASGNLDLAVAMILLADIKDANESQNSKK